MSVNIPDIAVASIADCYNEEGDIDSSLLSLFFQHDEQMMDEEEDDDDLDDDEHLDYLTSSSFLKKKKKRKGRKHSIKKIYLSTTEMDGTELQSTPTEMFWYKYYIHAPATDNAAFNKNFRLRFRLPYAQFNQLLNLIRDKEQFKTWQINDAVGDNNSPIELLLLGSLRYLGRAVTFDDLNENTAISRENLRLFFHTFIEFGSTFLFNMFVITPTTEAEAITHSHEFAIAGLPGCVGSMDATHVTMEKCSNRLRQTHCGPKQSLPARSFNIVANQRRKILSSTDGHPSRWNDKTLVLFDTFARGMHDGTILNDVAFELMEKMVLVKSLW